MNVRFVKFELLKINDISETWKFVRFYRMHACFRANYIYYHCFDARMNIAHKNARMNSEYCSLQLLSL